MKHIRIFTAVLLLLLLAGCGGASDAWKLSLPNDYCIVSYDEGNVRLEDADGSVYVGNYIRVFCHDDRYIAVQRVITADPDVATEQERENGFVAFYLTDTESGEVYGPMMEAELCEKCGELGIAELCDWIAVEPAPDGAVALD